MKRLNVILLALAVFLAVFGATVFAEPPVIRLWPDSMPGAKTIEAETEEPAGRINHVSDPTLLVYPAPKANATGQAVVVCPGGGYRRLAINHEGHDVARWLNSLGISAFILKYRMYDFGHPAPLQDAQRAVRIVRSHANEYGIDPGRIGIMGFSAGGHLASSAITHFNWEAYPPQDTIDKVSPRPDFGILIYPVISMQDEITHMGSQKNLLGENPTQKMKDFMSNEMQVTKDTPPSFLIHTTNDGAVPVMNSVRFYEAMLKAGVPAEMHIYKDGPHGFGLAPGRPALETWPGVCEAWLKGL